MADEEVVVNLTYDARASAQRLGADLDNSISKLQKVVDKTNEVSKSVERVNGSYSGLGRLADNLANSLDPWNNGLRTAIKEVDTLTTKITALNAKQSRSVSDEDLLTKSLQVRTLLVQKVEELRVASLAAAAAQDKLNSQAYIEGFSKFVTITKAATVSVEAHTQALNLFKLKIDTSITSLSSFANAQQVLANSTNRMTGDWTAATSLMTRLTEQFNPGIVAAKGMTAAMLELNTANRLGIISGDAFVAEQKRIADSFDPVIVKARAAAEAENQAHQAALSRFNDMVNTSKASQNASTAQLGIMGVTGQTAGSDFTRDIQLQMQAGVDAENKVTEAIKRTEVENDKLWQSYVDINNQRKIAIENERQLQEAKTSQIGISGVTGQTAGADFTRDIRLQMEAASEAAAANNKIIASQEALIASSKKVTQQVQIDDYNQVLASKQLMAQLQIQAEKENVAFDNRKVKDAADRVDYLTQKYNQDATAAKNYQKTILEINEAFNAHAIGFKEIGIETSKAIDVYNRSTVAGQKVIENTKAQTNAQFLNRIGLLELQAAGVNTFQAIFSGMSITHVAMMEGAQVIGAVIQGGRTLTQLMEGLGVAFNKAFTFLKSGVGLAITGITALVGVMGLAAIEAVQADTRMRAFGVILRSMGTDGYATSRSLDEVVKRLRETGTSAADAQKAIEAITRTPGINPAAVGNISGVARDISAARGIDLTAASTSLATAISGGGDALTKFALDLGVKFNPAEQKAIELAILHRNNLAQLNIAFGALARTMAGEYANSLGSTTKLVNALFSAYHDLMGAIGESAVWQTGIKGLTEFTKILTSLIKGDLKVDIRFNFLGPFGDFSLEDLKSQIGRLFGGAGPAASAAVPPPPKAGFGAAGEYGVGQGSGGGSSSLKGSSGLIPEFTSNLEKMFQAAAEEGVTLGIGSGLRSTATQARLYAEDIAKHGGTPSGMVAPPGRSFHEKGTAADLVDESGRMIKSGSAADTWLRANASRFDTTRPMSFEPWHVEPTSNVRTGGATSMTPLTVPSGVGSDVIPKITRDVNEAREAFGKWGLDLALADTKIRAVAEAEEKFKGSTPEDELKRQELVSERLRETTEKFNNELNKGIVIEDMRTDGTRKSIDVNDLESASIARRAAEAEAEILAKTTSIPKEVALRQILARQSTEATKAAGEATAALTPEIAGQRALGDALNTSAAAGHKQELANQAVANTQAAINAAVASGNPLDKTKIEQLKQENLARITQLDLAKQIVGFKQQDIQSKNEIENLQLQINLQGKTSQEIEKQTSLLATKNALDAAGIPVTNEEYLKRLLIVEAVGDMKIKFDEAQRAQQRLEDGLKQMAETIGTGIVTALQGLFDKSKVTDWMTTIKQGLQTIGQQLVSSTLIKPLTGSIFSALGLTKLAQEFGTFGGGSSGGGILGGLFGGGSGSSSGSNLTVVKNSDGSISIKDIASNGKGLFDAFSGSSSSDSGGFLSNLFGGGSNPLSSGFLGLDNTLATDAAFSGFGATQLGSSVGFAGGGELGGTLASVPAEGLLSGLGGIASGLGSVVPFIGPVIGLASMFLGGLFNKKPANNVSTGGINLSAGGSIVANPFSSGNAQNDQTAKQITDSISTFTKNILKETGGAISGNIDVQAGTRDGIKIGGTIGSVATGLVGVMKFTDAASAIAATTLAIAQHLEGVSDTMKNVLGQLTDPAQIENAVQFVNIYDKLDKSLKDSTVSVEAADAAFSSIASDTKGSGPFAQAMDQINTTFQTLTDTATGFGLALEPIKFGLDEATKRLKGDFLAALHSTFESVSGQDFINQLNSARQSYESNLKEATAVGLGSDQNTLDQISSVYNFQIYNILKGLSITQLDIVKNDLTDAFSVANPEINTLAENMKNVAFAANLALKATGDASVAFAGFAAGLQALRDLVVNLTVGQLSGAKIGTQIAAANENFSTELGLVKGGNLNELGNLATAGGNTVSLSQTAYGNAPQTARIRETILSGVNDILSNLPIPAFARGTRSTPEGMILVGEEGPELVMQGGGNKVIPLSGRGGNISELKAEIARLGEMIQNGTMVNREGFSQSVNHLGKISSNTETTRSLTPAMRRTA